MGDNANVVEALQQIANALVEIANALVGNALRGAKDQIQKIARMKECGLQNAEIARRLGTTANTVNVAVHSLRHKKKTPSKSKPKKTARRVK